jgi:tuftelin-interacting protein 11
VPPLFFRAPLPPSLTLAFLCPTPISESSRPKPKAYSSGEEDEATAGAGAGDSSDNAGKGDEDDEYPEDVDMAAPGEGEEEGDEDPQAQYFRPRPPGAGLGAAPAGAAAAASSRDTAATSAPKRGKKSSSGGRNKNAQKASAAGFGGAFAGASLGGTGLGFNKGGATGAGGFGSGGVAPAADDAAEERPRFGGPRPADLVRSALYSTGSSPANKASPSTAGPATTASTGNKKSSNSSNSNSSSSKPGSTSASTTATPTGKPGYSQFSGKDERPDKDYLKWTKFTSGFGLKMLQKQGFKLGQGLGSQNQGIIKPVEAHVRQQGLGLQESGERSKSARENLKVVDAEEVAEQRFQEEIKRWRIDGKTQNRKQKPRFNYKSADELAREVALADGADQAQTTPKPANKMKILDMTGKQVRELDSLADMAGQGIVYGSVPMPELQHNLNVLVSDASQTIRRASNRLRQENSTVAALTVEKTNMQATVAREAQDISRLQAVLKLIQGCKELVEQKSITVEDCAELFSTLQKQFQTEYHRYRLSTLFLAVALPLIKAELAAWVPAENPDLICTSFRRWKALVGQSNDETGGRDDLNDLDRMFWDAMQPVVVKALNTWDVLDPLPAVVLIEPWDNVSLFIHKQIGDIILRQLESEVADWNPVTCRVPIHQWIQPWIPLFSSRFKTLYPTIRSKIGLCLRQWQPTDDSALAIIAPWKGVWQAADMNKFLTVAVAPKLEAMLRDQLVINPQEQDMRPFDSALRWRDLLPTEGLAKLLEAHFFPKFVHVLCEWLSSPKPNYNDIANWYLFWRGRFAKDLILSPVIQVGWGMVCVCWVFMCVCVCVGCVCVCVLCVLVCSFSVSLGMSGV